MQKTTYINPTSPSFCMDRNLCEMFANHLGLNVEVEKFTTCSGILLTFMDLCVCDFHLQNEANKIKKEAEELDQLIARKLKDYEDLREDMKGKELEVKNLLEKGKTEQQVSSVLCSLLFPGGGEIKTKQGRQVTSQM